MTKTKVASNSFFVIASSGLLLISLPGCTLIGGIVGSQIVIREEMESDVSPFPHGTEVEISLKHGRRITGAYSGSDLMDDEAYASVYESSVRAQMPDCPLPGLNQRLTVRSHPDSSNQTILFQGFGGYRHYKLLGTETETGQAWMMPIERVIETIDEDSNKLGRSN